MDQRRLGWPSILTSLHRCRPIGKDPFDSPFTLVREGRQNRDLLDFRKETVRTRPNINRSADCHQQILPRIIVLTRECLFNLAGLWAAITSCIPVQFHPSCESCLCQGFDESILQPSQPVPDEFGSIKVQEITRTPLGCSDVVQHYDSRWIGANEVDAPAVIGIALVDTVQDDGLNMAGHQPLQ